MTLIHLVGPGMYLRRRLHPLPGNRLAMVAGLGTRLGCVSRIPGRKCGETTSRTEKLNALYPRFYPWLCQCCPSVIAVESESCCGQWWTCLPVVGQRPIKHVARRGSFGIT